MSVANKHSAPTWPTGAVTRLTAGASGLKLVKFLAGGGVFTVGEIGALLVGCIVAFVVSILAIRFLMDYVKKHTFTAFGWYRIALGIVVLGVWALQTFVLA